MPLKPMLAKDVDWKRLTYPVAVQPKIDGIRVHVQDGIALTRTLKRVPNASIQAALGRPEFEGLDGEVVVGDPTASDAYRRTSSFVMAGDKTGDPWTFFVFDIIDTNLWTYNVRRESLRFRQDAWPSNFSLVPEGLAHSAAHLESMEELIVTQQGYEGVILRTLDAPYKHGRSTPGGPLLKVKRFTDFEAEVVGVYEEQHNGNLGFTNELGRTSRSTSAAGKTGKGTLGGLVCKALNGPWEGVEFRVGTGFDATERADLWRENNYGHGNALTGSVAKIKAFTVGAKDKPRHSVFLGWRDLGLDG